MKTRYILPALLLMGATLTSTQATANGLTYDPYANYYSEFYGIGGAITAIEVETQVQTEFYDPYAEYYNTYYGIDGLVDEKQTAKVVEPTDSKDSADYTDMSDPSNYYSW